MVRFKPQIGFDSEYTQALANYLPIWHRIRFDPTATGQDLLNSYAMGLSEIHQFLKHNRKNQYIGTADTLVRTHAYRAEVPQKLRARGSRQINFLRNSSFRQQGQAFFNHPLEWQVTSGEHYPLDGYKGHGSIKLEPNGSFYQIVSGEEFRKGQTYTAGVWVKGAGSSETNRGTLRFDVTGWGWSQFDESNFDLGTDGEWTREEISITPTGDMRTLKLTVTSQPTGDLDVYFSAPMMNEGDDIEEWEPGADPGVGDFRTYMAGPTGETQHLIELGAVDNEFLLFEDAIPTRIEASLTVTGDIISNNFGPPVYEWTKDFWDTEFRISGDVIQQYAARLPSEVWYSYSILDRYMDNEVNTGEYGYLTGEYDGFTRTLEALCVWRRRIYLVCKESYGGNTYRILKILRWQGIDERLETIRDLRVGVDTGSISSIGFVEGRMDQLAITLDDDTQWTLQLYFDYFLYDSSRRQVILRHPYTGYTLNFVEL